MGDDKAEQKVTNVMVVGVDMGPTGEQAMGEALRLAAQLPGTDLHAVYVIRIPSEMHSAEKIDEISERVDTARGDLREHVTKLVGPVETDGPFKGSLTLHVRLGEHADAIHQLAVDVEADMIVVGTHGRAGMKRWVLGSCAEALMRMAHAPVYVARPKDYAGLEKSATPEAPRPGQDLSSAGYSDSFRLSTPSRTSHISGLL